MISERVSHYQVVRKLGAGGMGEVYLAEDSRLGRQVALKFLPASYQYDPDRRARFMKEARAASALSSPNIAAIYDIGEHEGTNFIVMEYVEGETIAQWIKRAPLSVNEVIEISIQVADALDEAHSLGIVHRDIKSSNVIINARGVAKVLDFGLAKVMEQLGGPEDSYRTVPLDASSVHTVLLDSDHEETFTLGKATTAGLVVGTVPYMSPEQALGQKVDYRADLFSLGVVIYEMLTGRLPFEGKSTTELIDRIVHHEPPAIARFNYDAPPELERVVRKCLEKRNADRYQSARDLLVDLRNLRRDSGTNAVATATARMPSRRSGSRKSIDSLAILPLLNVNADPEVEYLCDGITENIIKNLSQLPKLKVMARSTVFRYKGREVDPQVVARELGVRAVLTGRVLQRADTLVIKTELVDAADGSQLWGEHYNRKLADIFTVEEEISREISEKLRLKLTGEQKKRLTKRYTESSEAYQAYLKGRYHWNKRSEESLKRGIEYFQKAIDIDNRYAPAYVGLADSYNILASYSSLPPEDAFSKAKAAVTRALEIDDSLAEAHSSLAFVMFGYDWDYPGAEREFKRAININGSYATAHHWYALYLIAMGRQREALGAIKQAQKLEPLSLIIGTSVGWIYYLSREYDKAIDAYRKTLDMEQSFLLAHRRLGQAYLEKGMYDLAMIEYEKASALSKEDVESLAALGHGCAIRGDREGAGEILTRLKAMSGQRYVPAFFIAKIYLALDERETAFAWFEKACEERYGYLAYLNADPAFDAIRSDPRFQELVRRVGLG